MKVANVLLLVALAATIGGNIAVGGDPSIPARDYFPEMVYSRAAESYSASAVLDGGVTLQPPPDGTVAINASLVRYDPTPAGAVRAGAELTAPPVTAPDVQRGRTIFATFCTPCHGAGAAGDGPVVARGFPAPPSLLAQRARDMKDGQMFHVVTYGQVNMPSYAAQIVDADRWHVIAYVRQLQGSTQP